MRVNESVHGAACPRAARFAPYGEVTGPARYSIRLAASVSEKTMGMGRYGSAPRSSHSSRNSCHPYGIVPLFVANTVYSGRRCANGGPMRSSSESPRSRQCARSPPGLKERSAATTGSRKAVVLVGSPLGCSRLTSSRRTEETLGGKERTTKPTGALGVSAAEESTLSGPQDCQSVTFAFAH